MGQTFWLLCFKLTHGYRLATLYCNWGWGDLVMRRELGVALIGLICALFCNGSSFAQGALQQRAEQCNSRASSEEKLGCFVAFSKEFGACKDKNSDDEQLACYQSLSGLVAKPSSPDSGKPVCPWANPRSMASASSSAGASIR